MQKDYRKGDGFVRLGQDLDSKGSDSIIRPSVDNKKMKLSKGTITSIVIVLLTVVVGGFLVVTKKDGLFNNGSTATSQITAVGIKFTEKNYKLNYSSLDKDTVLEIADFEKNEPWRGNNDFDTDIFWTGESSLLLESKDNEKIESFIDKKVDLSKYQIFRIAVYLKTDPSDVESIRLYFGNLDRTAYYVYPFTNLVKGWNFIRIPKMKFSSVNAVKDTLAKPVNEKGVVVTVKPASFSWDKVERVGLEVVSRNNSTTAVNFDTLNGIYNDDYLDDWLTLSPLFFDLAKNDGKTILKAKNVGSSTALIKKLSGLRDFTFKAKVIPQRINARSGLFIRGDYKTNYGYYFLVDGINGNRWQIMKIALIDEKAQTVILKNGIINNFMVENDKPLWLKVEAKGSNLKFFLSTDNKSFTMLGEINDGDIKEGGAGISVYDSGASLFDEFEFSQ